MGSWARLARRVARMSRSPFSIDCSGSRHAVLRTPAGLVLLDHDMDAEAALMALGGAKAACLVLADDWQKEDLHQLWALLGDEGAPNPFRDALFEEERLHRRSPKEVIERTVRLTPLPLDLRHALVVEKVMSRFSKSLKTVRDYVADICLDILKGRPQLTESDVQRLLLLGTVLWRWEQEEGWKIEELAQLEPLFVDGRLAQIPDDPSELQLAMRAIAAAIPIGHTFTRTEIERFLSGWTPAPTAARDFMLHSGLLERHGSRYRRN